MTDLDDSFDEVCDPGDDIDDVPLAQVPSMLSGEPAPDD